MEARIKKKKIHPVAVKTPRETALKRIGLCGGGFGTDGIESEEKQGSAWPETSQNRRRLEMWELKLQ